MNITSLKWTIWAYLLIMNIIPVRIHGSNEAMGKIIKCLSSSLKHLIIFFSVRGREAKYILIEFKTNKLCNIVREKIRLGAINSFVNWFCDINMVAYIECEGTNMKDTINKV